MASNVTVHEIMDAFSSMRRAMTDMCEQVGHMSDTVHDAMRSVESHLRCVLAIDPAKVVDEHQAVTELVVGDRTSTAEALEKIDLCETHLTDWTGDAADAFSIRLTRMRSFCDDQQVRLTESLRDLEAWYAASAGARRAYHTLLNAVAAGATKVKNDEADKQTEWYVTQGFNFAAGILTRSPEGVAKTLMDIAKEVAKDTIPMTLNNSDADDVASAYRREADAICQQLGHLYDSIEGNIANASRSASAAPAISDPLDPDMDVTKPEFTYGKFMPKGYHPPNMTTRVEDQRRAYAEEKTREDSEINRRLDHGDRGPV